MIQPQSIEQLPTVGPGETIVPGSLELQAEENLNSPSDELPAELPVPDLSSKTDTDQMFELSAAIEAEESDPSLMILPTEPIVWEVQPFGISSAGQVSPVSIRTAVDSH